MLVPKLIADAGEHASLRFLDFFTANIRNPNTRAAYAVAVRAFFSGSIPSTSRRSRRAHASRLGLRGSPRPPQIVIG